MRWTGGIVLGLLAVILLAPVAAWFWLSGSVPDRLDSAELPGLEGDVRILTDGDGIPHIFAEADHDAYMALGYLHARDRLWQMEAQRRIGAGRLSEISYFDVLDIDRYMRTLGLYRAAERSFDFLSEDTQAALRSYADGVNAYLAVRTEPLPPEFQFLQFEPEPWTPADSLVWGKLMSIQLGYDYRDELLRVRLDAEVGAERTESLFVDSGRATPGVDRAALLEGLHRALPDPLGPRLASNEWVVDGSRTESGAPILANDPHLGLSSPVLWYLARIETPNWQLAGATVPGVPLVLLGHNGHAAWGFTTTGADVQDLFIERLDPDDPLAYMTEEGSRPFTQRQEEIRVRFADPVNLTVRETRNGPVISDLSDDYDALADGEHVVALAFTALSEADTTSEAIFRLNRARSFDEFEQAMRLWVSPVQNVVFADLAGQTAFKTAGHVPLRVGRDGLRPAEGWTEGAGWQAMIPFDEMPTIAPGERAVIINANNAIAAPGEAAAPSTWGRVPPHRADRLAALLDLPESSLSLDTAGDILNDIVSFGARDLLPHLLTADAAGPAEAEALASLRTWDLRMDRNRPEPLIFTAWIWQLRRGLLADDLGPLYAEMDAVDSRLLIRWLGEDSSWCDDITTEDIVEVCADILNATLSRSLAALRESYGEDITAWRWGDAHVANLSHQIFGRIPLASSLLDIGVETDGGDFTINRGAALPDETMTRFDHHHGAGLRAVYDLSDLARSRFMIATGQSGHPWSDRYGNFVQAWRDGRYIEIAGSPDDLAAAGATPLTLQPR